MKWPAQDPAFVTAVERHYLAEVNRKPRVLGAEPHRTALAAAIYAADRTNGGFRFRSLDPRLRAELERRLVRYATVQEPTAQSPQ